MPSGYGGEVEESGMSENGVVWCDDHEHELSQQASISWSFGVTDNFLIAFTGHRDISGDR